MSEPLRGRVLDNRYRLDLCLGTGGMGAVYRAQHLLLEERVAIKVLRADRAHDPTAVRRFLREAKQTFRFDHPHCLRVTDFGACDDGLLYLVMDYLDGRTAAREIAVDGPMSAARVAHVGAQVAQALAYAHGLGLLHRDLKPDNVMLLRKDDDPDFAKVLDFGLAKLFDPAGAIATALSLSPLTQKGIVFGTPEYMSPEQARGDDLGPASDAYSLGVVCYELLTGEVPFVGQTFTEILGKHVTEEPRRPASLRPMPAPLEELVLALLAKRPENRPDIRELALALPAAAAGKVSTIIPSQSPPAERESTQAPTLELSAAGDARPGGTVLGIGEALTNPAAPAGRSHADTDLGPPVRRSRWGWIGAALFAAAVCGGAIALSMRGRAASAPARADSGIADAAAPADASAPDGGVTRAHIDAGGSTVDPELSDRERELRRHLRRAESARRAGNPLRQLAHADAALAVDPGNRRALLLAGQALIDAGDRERGCSYLRRASRRSFEAAGCAD